MFTKFLSLGFCLTLPFVPDRAPRGEKTNPDVEKQWYDRLAKVGWLRIDLKEGHIELRSPRVVKGRKLIDFVLAQYDDKEKRRVTICARDAELRLADEGKTLVLQMRDCDFVNHDDGYRARIGDRLIRLELRPRPRD